MRRRREIQASGGDVEAREERLRELGVVTGELMHDLGGIVSVLAGRVALAREEAALGRTPMDELAQIQADADEMRRMVLEILEELRGAHTSPEVTFAVTDTLEDTIDRWLIGGPSVNTTLDSTLPREVEVAGPRSFFSRAIGNLLRNAARHARREIRISLRSLDDGDRVEIRIEDDGDGIPPDLRARLFDPFISRSRSGTGLGLSFARWGVERLGGTLSADEVPSPLGGACFRVTLPVSSVVPRAGSTHRFFPGTPPHMQSPTPLDGLRVVVVDDDQAVRRTFGRLLRRSGAEVADLDPGPWSSPALAALEICRESPDAVLLDVDLRRLSGLEVYAAVANRAPDVASRVVFFTGGAPPPEGTGRPTLNKMVAWHELVACVLGVAGRGDGGG